MLIYINQVSEKSLRNLSELTIENMMYKQLI